MSISKTPMSSIGNTLRSIGVNPFVTSLMAGVGTAVAARAVLPHTVGSLYRTAGTLVPGLNITEKEIREAEDEYNAPGSKWSTWIPVGLGALAAAGVALPQMDFRGTSNGGHPFMGLFTPYKKGSESFNWEGNDQIDLDMGKLIPINATKATVLSNPYLEPYQAGSVLGVINEATRGQSAGMVPLGNVFDSALNRIQDNLTLSGVAKAGVRGIVGYGMAKVLTAGLSTVMDIPPKVREGANVAGAFANIVGSVF